MRVEPKFLAKGVSRERRYPFFNPTALRYCWLFRGKTLFERKIKAFRSAIGLFTYVPKAYKIVRVMGLTHHSLLSILKSWVATSDLRLPISDF
ncbi:hypothetical protein G7B40_025375 [Aetokthonos hydrillicola Thurmond2011]|uniref:Uncharacterized protein n=1 Tax=Aetokthonos hydrillicola Thurmond2011 TaxID=2712845 RepID=A0AAP5IAY5_9CYAN|nr:hypothetical protein [Aetokthonos hydrillicola]MBO3458411.1 hypothetical protein [Aetokthonos hydrillicola CCALA 1050]MBW4586262.1 hypothetical protein [Aetokthonos hydrillicola CCALA 1050]MDR9897869.1 hypothetical protein [Aetokthonos hydrillicola Thurmond2011]